MSLLRRQQDFTWQHWHWGKLLDAHLWLARVGKILSPVGCSQHAALSLEYFFLSFSYFLSQTPKSLLAVSGKYLRNISVMKWIEGTWLAQRHRQMGNTTPQPRYLRTTSTETQLTQEKLLSFLRRFSLDVPTKLTQHSSYIQVIFMI